MNGVDESVKTVLHLLYDIPMDNMYPVWADEGYLKAVRVVNSTLTDKQKQDLEEYLPVGIGVIWE